MTIADRIKAKRIERDMSQTDLALRAGYSNKTAISKFEHAGDDISMKQIRRIATALNVSPAYLMGWEEDQELMPSDTVLPIFNETDEHLLKIIEYYKNATPEAQSVVETVLKSAQQKP